MGWRIGVTSHPTGQGVAVDAMWACSQCHSINTPNYAKCYSCQTPRASDPAPLLETHGSEVASAAPVGGTVIGDPESWSATGDPDIGGVSPPAVSNERAGNDQKDAVALAPHDLGSGALPGPVVLAESLGPYQICAQCGAKSAPDAQFCAACGHLISNLPTTPVVGTSALGQQVPRSLRRAPRRLVLLSMGAGVLAIALVAAAIGILPGSGYTVNGTFKLYQAIGTGVSNFSFPSDTGSGVCSGENGYGDIAPGMQITVQDENGKLVGTGQLGQGQISLDLSHGSGCFFSFTIHGVPKSAYYRIGTDRRGTISYSFDQLGASNWTVELTLGT